MVKGVNKQIIEINNTDSIYFDKVIFYLKPGVRMLPTEVSVREAEKIISQYGIQHRRTVFGRRLIYTALIVTLALFGILIFV